MCMTMLAIEDTSLGPVCLCTFLYIALHPIAYAGVNVHACIHEYVGVWPRGHLVLVCSFGRQSINYSCGYVDNVK